MRNRIIPYNPTLKILARKLRKQGILSEVLLWKDIKKKALGVEFHRQVPIDNYIVDFFCHELMLAIEIDGSSHDFSEISVNDVTREERLRTLGILIVRFQDKEVRYYRMNVLRELEIAIEDRRVELNIPLNPPSKGELPGK